MVQQQAPYFDSPHIAIALLHLALLMAQQQRQAAAAAAQQQRAAGGAAAAFRQQRAAANAAAGANGHAPLVTAGAVQQLRPAAAPAPAEATNGIPAAAAAAASLGAPVASAAAVAAGAAAPAAPQPPSPAASTLRLLLRLALLRLDELDGPTLSRILSALAAMRYRDKVVLEQLTQVLLLCRARLGCPTAGGVGGGVRWGCDGTACGAACEGQGAWVAAMHACVWRPRAGQGPILASHPPKRSA